MRSRLDWWESKRTIYQHPAKRVLKTTFYELKGENVIKFVNGTEGYTVTLTADGKPLAKQEILITLVPGSKPTPFK